MGLVDKHKIAGVSSHLLRVKRHFLDLYWYSTVPGVCHLPVFICRNLKIVKSINIDTLENASSDKLVFYKNTNKLKKNQTIASPTTYG